jgi:hypothetical protein
MKILNKLIGCCALAGFLGGATAHALTVPVTTDILSGTTNTWYATNIYRLDTMIYVQSNAVLVIEPGTVVQGATNVTIARTDLPELVSGLWVTRGGKLYATGTVDKPIIFTGEGDNLNGNTPPTQTALWGGVVIMGNASINSAKNASGNVATPKYDVYEGVTGPGPNNEHVFGGNNDEDSSGALQYVSIRHCGKIFAPSAELNCLTMGGVGRGTVLEYVEVFAGSDDGFEWWGGTVNSKHLVAAFIEDDDFDTDQGYRGTNQFWFGLKLRGGGVTSGGRGFETDGDVSPGNGTATPYSQWAAYNVTLIGRGKDVTTAAEGLGWFLEDGSAPNVFNSIFTDLNQGFQIQGDGLYHFTNTTVRAFVQNNIWDVNTNANSAGAFLFSTASFSNTVQSAMLGGVSYTNNGGLNPRPADGSPAFDNVLGGAPEAADYRGAFSGTDDAWADDWTALSSLGYLAPAGTKPVISVTNDIASGTTNTWYAGNIYRLDTMIYVQSNAVLVIEPGTVIQGATNVTIARTDLPELVSGLWVTRGGKLYATGTVDKPIIFTGEGDNLNGNTPPTQTALWGGVVIMGNASINSAKDASGNVASPKYDVYEGVTGPGPNGEHLFGGNNDEDSSGALQYVSIRHCGKIFAPSAELNCLTMGGVGRGTVLEYVEVFAGSDDGFEWWGGTVNSKHLVAAFIEDDDFDTDQGYRGTNQFWFGLKLRGGGVTSGGRGFETDGDVSPGNGTATPYSQWVAHNVTLIGRGKDVTTAAAGLGWFLEDGSAPNVFNSIISDYNQGFQIQGDGLYHFTNTTVRAFVQNNIWDVNTNANSAGAFLFSTASFSNTVQSAMLGGVSYTNNGGLDPRPQPGSPALTDVMPGAPTAVSYRGAFGPNDNWANSWTALAGLGYLNTNAVVVVPPTAPSITTVAGGGTMSFAITSQNGYSYILQSTPVLTPPAWTTKETLPGNGGVLNFTPVATTNSMEYFRILAQ